jgi:antitoxin component of MazEF toxin-antitoxin module
MKKDGNIRRSGNSFILAIPPDWLSPDEKDRGGLRVAITYDEEKIIVRRKKK